MNYKELAPKFKGLSHADVERVCFDAIKASILDDKDSLDQEVLEEALKRQKKRLDIAENASKRRKN